MSKKFGVSLADKIAEDVERPLEYGDTRSERVEELVAAGLRAEELCTEYGFEYEDRHEFQSLITQAFLALDRQDRQEGEVNQAET
jgi:hypothetical protein